MSVRLTFWFDFASTYSYLTLQRMERAADAAGVAVEWRPFLLGPIFVAQGWNTSPFVVYPAKGAFMFRDVARRAAADGLPFIAEATMPVNSVSAARWGIAALEGPLGPAFCKRVSFAHWGENRDITSAEVLAACAQDVGLAPDAIAARADAADLKPRLRENVDAAIALGVFGAPSFTVETDGKTELFWGDDQLGDAFSWARMGALPPR